MRKLCILTVLLLCLCSTGIAEYVMPERIGVVGIIEAMTEGDSFVLLNPDEIRYEVHMTDDTRVNTSEPLREGLIVDVLFAEPIETKGGAQPPVNAARIQDGMYDMYIHEDGAPGANPVGAGGIVSLNPMVQFPEGTDTDAIKGKYIRFRPYAVDVRPITELVQARAFEPVALVDGDILSLEDGVMGFLPYNTQEEVRVLITEETTLVHTLREGMSICVVYSAEEGADVPPEIDALTIWPNFG